MNFLELQTRFESKIKDVLKFELLELRYHPYAFGSGLVAYRIKGKNVKLNYDGRDDLVTVYLTSKQVRYPDEPWNELFMAPPNEFLKEGITKLISEILK